MCDFTVAIALYECVVLAVELRASDMLSKCHSMTCIPPSYIPSPSCQSGRKTLERAKNSAAHLILQSSIWPVCYVRHKPSFNANAVSFSLLTPYSEEGLPTYLGDYNAVLWCS